MEQSEGDVDLRCPNSQSCPAQLRERLYYIGSRAALDIDVLGYEAASALLDAKIIKDESELFDLTEELLVKSEFFKKMDGSAAANVKKLLLSGKTYELLHSINKVKNISTVLVYNSWLVATIQYTELFTRV